MFWGIIKPEEQKVAKKKLSRREERARQRAREGLRNRLLLAGGAILVLALGGWWLYTQATAPPPPGNAVPIIGFEHVNPGDPSPYEYNSNPPTSGWHYPQPAEAGFYEEPIPDGYLIHSLEHGHVIIHYNCATLSEAECQDLVAKLTDLFNREGAWKLIAVPRPELDTVLAITAWGWIDKFNEYDEARIQRFIAAYRDRGPEGTPE